MSSKFEGENNRLREIEVLSGGWSLALLDCPMRWDAAQGKPEPGEIMLVDMCRGSNSHDVTAKVIRFDENYPPEGSTIFPSEQGRDVRFPGDDVKVRHDCAEDMLRAIVNLVHDDLAEGGRLDIIAPNILVRPFETIRISKFEPDVRNKIKIIEKRASVQQE